MKRFFLAHAKSDSIEVIDQYVAIARGCLEPVSKGEPFEITTGRDYFELRFKACGSWDAWASEVGSGLSFTTRKPIFDGYMVPSARVGAGTARIVEHALSSRKPVFLFRGDGAVARVLAVKLIDRGNFQEGWQLTAGQWIVGKA